MNKKQKAGPIPYHSQSYVGKEINKVIQSGHKNTKCRRGQLRIFRSNNREERLISKNCIGLRKSNDSCMKMTPHMSNVEKLLIQISNEKTRVQKERLWMSKIISSMRTAY